MYKVLKPFIDNSHNRRWSRGVVAAGNEFGDQKVVQQLISDGFVAEFEPNGEPVLLGDTLAARIAQLERENAELRAKIAELGAVKQHPFESINGVGAEIAVALEKAGFNSLEEIRDADDDRLLAIAGIDKALVRRIREHFARGD